MFHVAHFAINADNVARARGFYEKVFGWKFKAYGPPGFYRVELTGVANAMVGAVQQRREIVPGVAMHGFECTIAVSDIHSTKAAIEANGGTIAMPICTLTGVGQLLFFQDPEGNIAGAMQYDNKAE